MIEIPGTRTGLPTGACGAVPADVVTRPRRRLRITQSLLLLLAMLVVLGPTSTSRAGATEYVAPTGTFSTTVSGLDVHVAVTSSAPADASFCWDFGDPPPEVWGGGAMLCSSGPIGPTASHTYSAAGSYTIILTVLDDSTGDASLVSQQVTVSGAAADQSPTASFTTSMSGLTVVVDGASSHDVDGTVVGWCWTFAAGETAPRCDAGSRTSYTYPAAGTYTVGLEVIDDDGFRASTSQAVTVNPPAPPPGTVLARDPFSRTVATGWGTAEVGGAWSTTGSGHSVSAGTAAHRIATAGSTLVSALPAVSATRAQVLVAVSVDKVPRRGSASVTAVARRVGPADYGARVTFDPDKTVSLHLLGAGTALSGVTVPRLAYAAGTQLRVRVQAIGTSPTSLYAKVWKAGTLEPSGWQVTSTDNTVALQSAGSVGLVSQLSPAATNAPLTIRVDDLTVTSQ